MQDSDVIVMGFNKFLGNKDLFLSGKLFVLSNHYTNSPNFSWIYRGVRGRDQHIWMIETSRISYYGINVVFSIVGKSRISYDDFADFLAKNHPDDLTWVYFHPEIIKGEHHV